MVGEHYPSGWNHKQVSIDFIGGTSSLTGRVINSTAAGCVVELVPEAGAVGRAKRASCSANLLPMDRHTIH
jgi:hypothetical protein